MSRPAPLQLKKDHTERCWNSEQEDYPTRGLDALETVRDGRDEDHPTHSRHNAQQDSQSPDSFGHLVHQFTVSKPTMTGTSTPSCSAQALAEPLPYKASTLWCWKITGSKDRVLE
jgi:hypothetical protein